jgi:serine/threonine protein kinase/tetratricopeptide (TPR) repeat protein
MRYCTQFQAQGKIEVTETIETPKEELTTGSTFAGRYQVIEELGKGGMGKVYKVLDKETNEKIALKLIKPEIASDKKTVERFRNELTTARKIVQKNVCRMYDLNKEKGNYYITMEYISGQDLKGLIRQTGQLTVGKAVSIAKQICDGLAEAHSLGVVHRDLKPNNIMIDKEGNAKIMDFGIARSLEAKGITGAGVMIGTPDYMSPEQVDGKETDQRSDIYSLGVILYEMVTGRVPFEGDTPFSIGVKQKSEIPRPPKEINEQIPEDLNRVILKCMEKDKEKRYQSVGELHSELMNLEKGIPTTERIVPERKPLTSREITVQFNVKKLLVPAVAIMVLVIAALVIWQLRYPKTESSATSGQPSVAVLPFEDLSPEKDQRPLCDGFAESIINALTRIKDLRVPAPTSSFLFSATEVDVQEIATALNVRTVLRGSVQKAGNRVRITTQLIDAKDESLLWSHQYNRELDDIFAIQDEITLEIVDNLKVELLGEERVELVKRYTDNPAAYDSYVHGRFLWNKRTPKDILESIKYFERAIEADPTYTLAYTGLADSYIISGEWALFRPKEAYQKAKTAALKALEIDERLAEAHNALAMIKREFDFDWAGAERDFKRAIELNPNYSTAHQWYAEYLVTMGRFDEAIAEIKRAQDLDPLSLVKKTIGGMVYVYARKFDLGIEQCQKVLELDPSFQFARYFLGLNYIGAGKYEEAIIELQAVWDLTKGLNLFALSSMGYAYAMLDKRVKATQILDQLYERSNESYVGPNYFSLIYIGLGEYDKALDFLEKAYEPEDRHFILAFIKVAIEFDVLRSDPRFKALLKKMNLE